MPTINGARLRQLRLALGQTQTELSLQIGMNSNSLISRVETGRAPADSEIDDLATALACTPIFLSTAPIEVLATKPWLRAYADAPIKIVDSVVADNALALEIMNDLNLDRIPETIPRFYGDRNDYEAIEAHAFDVRAAAGIEEGGVVRNVMRAAERLGCVLLPLSDELGRHLGLSQYIDGVPHIRVSRPRPNVPGDRQRFTVAHEVGHLSLHAHLAPPETAEDARSIEAEAHRFAGAFLAPRDALLEDLATIDDRSRVTISSLQKLKSTWGVAIKMLVTRFRQLGVIGDSQAVSLYKQISKRGWNSGEPVHVRHEEPVWLGRALIKRWGDDRPELRAAATTGVGSAHLTRWGEWTPGVDADVITFDPTRRAPRLTNGATTTGGVTVLHRD